MVVIGLILACGHYGGGGWVVVMVVVVFFFFFFFFLFKWVDLWRWWMGFTVVGG